ncbi:hypothetical protein DNTS_003347 [Danionella cerebrum]|uniref:Uncharacterized protein n=1 Tax=Danionella cerebrum TaxID=2873325 RepID=A0A553NLQ7_9TELE|nr:hypothetical protein DNTS_003347 [Danionella translucida]
MYQKLLLKSVSSLKLSMELTLHEPFGLCDYDGDELFTTSKSLVMGVGAQTELWVSFNPKYFPDRFSRVVEDGLEFCYHGHPQQDRVKLKAEVHFPNLSLSSTMLDFGCILNNTKSRRKLSMTNSSPLCVSYRWAFLVDQQQCYIEFSEKTSQGIEGDAGGKRKESEMTMTQLEENVNCNRDDQNGTFSLQKNKELRGKHHNLAANGHSSLDVKEVFDISSLYGELQPGDSKLVTFSFLGHTEIRTQVLALCEVEGGPTYEVTLKGQASSVSYSLDTNDLDFGLQLFDNVAEAELTLRNTGKVGFDFSTVNGQQASFTEWPLPGQPLIIPSMGHLEQNGEIKLSVCYLPGIPGIFQKSVHLQVAFYESESITVRGEAVFPRLSLDLPRNLDKEMYGPLLNEAKDSVEDEQLKEDVLSTPVKKEIPPEDDCVPSFDALLQMELERLIVKKHAIAVYKHLQAPDQRGNGSAISWIKKLCKLILPEYTLDFGYVIKDSTVTHIVKVTNTCPLAVSFKADRSSLAGTGFSTELDRVQNLPFCETETFEVKFDAHGAILGKIDAVMPIQVSKGPQVLVRLLAEVTMPSLSVSSDILHFDSIQCGQCQVITVQLHNEGPVSCEWSIKQEEHSKKIEKLIPPYLRRQAQRKQRLPPVVFETLPSKGTLHPGDRTNVQVKFSPAEGKTYKQKLVMRVAQSSQRILLVAHGQGEDPQLQFSSSVIDFGSILPFSEGKMMDVTVCNPCSFPVEFYSVDFDKQYQEEEEILRLLKGYNAQNVLLLPPRSPGETLPLELLDFYKAHCSKEDSTDDLLETDKEEALLQSEGVVKDNSTVTAVGDLEYDPVALAIARHMGIDLSPEGKAALNRRGVAILVHGAPLSGKTRIAVTLARHYGAACLTVDEVVQEAVASGSTSAAFRARELSTRLAVLSALREGDEAAVDLMTAPVQVSSVLSVEAVAKHAAEGSQTSIPKVVPSSASTRNKTNVTGRSQKNDSSAPDASLTEGLVNRRLSVSASQNEEVGLMSSFLPEDLLVELLSERLQLSDCHHGVVIDGLETQYCRSLCNVLQIVLKAFNNRRHIYVINLFNSYSIFKHREQHKFEQDMEERRKWELENLRDDETTPSEDWNPNIMQHHPLPYFESQQEEMSSESNRQLEARFNLYEKFQSDLQHVLEFWERTQSLLLQPLPSESQQTDDLRDCPPPSAKKNKKDREKERAEKEKLKLEAEMKSPASNQPQIGDQTDAAEAPEKMVVSEPIPYIWLSLKENTELDGSVIIRTFNLPSQEEILDGLGLGPKGPPIPLPVTFSIVPYPKMRSVTNTQPSSCFSFLKLVPEDLSLMNMESLQSETVQEVSTVTDYRWTVPPNGVATLKIWFNSSVVGHFDQHFSFEVLGTKKGYELYCKGICAFPSISQDPVILFARCNKSQYHETGLQKTYVIQSGIYEFGPLLCGKSRNRYKEGIHPENMDKFVIHNNSQMEAEIQFCFQHDTNATTFILDPSKMRLEPNQRKILKVWAYPNTPKLIEDRVVCCIEGNPEPVTFSLSCIGVRPELETDRKTLQFDKTPLFRKESQTLHLSNNTLLPVAWKLRGLELLGEELQVSQSHGIILPYSDFLLHVSDVDNILGLIQHSESIQIIAEAYDIAVDITIPEGSLLLTAH